MKVASFAFSTPNLGDDLQVIAAATFLPWVDRLVDRDKLAEVALDEPHLVVMNSWFQLADRLLKYGWRKKRWCPSPSIEPLFYGFCVGRDRILNDSWTPYLAAHQPIGCRDRMSVEKLRASSVDGYWTGCITAFFGRGYAPVPASERSGIVFVDLPEQAEQAFVPSGLRGRAQRLTNATPTDILHDPLARMHRVASTCDVLRRAELVVTSRLHVALPCIGFGTPVVALVRERPTALRRFSGFDEFLPLIFYGGKRQAMSVDWDSRDPIAVPEEIEQRHAEFLGRLEERLGAVCRDVAPNVVETWNLRIRDHGLGETGGEVQIDFGRFAATRPVSRWSGDEIEVRLDGIAALRRFRIPVRARASATKPWTDMGLLSDLLT